MAFLPYLLLFVLLVNSTPSPLAFLFLLFAFANVVALASCLRKSIVIIIVVIICSIIVIIVSYIVLLICNHCPVLPKLLLWLFVLEIDFVIKRCKDWIALILILYICKQISTTSYKVRQLINKQIWKQVVEINIEKISTKGIGLFVSEIKLTFRDNTLSGLVRLWFYPWHWLT